MNTIIFLCNGEAEYYSEKGIIKNRELPGLIKSVISSGDYYITSWSCGNSKFIQVGDRAYLQRSGNMGNEPSGFIAAGRVVAAPENRQLKLKDKKKYSGLSEAYEYDEDGCFYISIKIDSIVDFDFPLQQKKLKKLPQFKDVNFNFGGSGCRFNSEAAPFLDLEWKDHSLGQQSQGRGRRLVDFFCEQGESFKQNKEYQKAIDAYKLALKIDSEYTKAIDEIESCKLILKKKIIISPEEKALLDAIKKLDKEEFFSFKNDAEAREKITVSIARRQGQSKFRQSLLDAYSGRCAITNFDAEAALEAAHIIPYVETENNHPSNGLLLRDDLHTLFDLNLIAVNPKTMKVHISPELEKTEYRSVHGKELRLPKNEMYRPKEEYLNQRFKQYKWCHDN